MDQQPCQQDGQEGQNKGSVQDPAQAPGRPGPAAKSNQGQLAPDALKLPPAGGENPAGLQGPQHPFGDAEAAGAVRPGQLTIKGIGQLEHLLPVVFHIVVLAALAGIGKGAHGHTLSQSGMHGWASCL